MCIRDRAEAEAEAEGDSFEIQSKRKAEESLEATKDKELKV